MAPSRCAASPAGRDEALVQGLAGSIYDLALRDVFLETRSVREVLARTDHNQSKK
jgi:hypothetical protein